MLKVNRGKGGRWQEPGPSADAPPCLGTQWHLQDRNRIQVGPHICPLTPIKAMLFWTKNVLALQAAIRIQSYNGAQVASREPECLGGKKQIDVNKKLTTSC